MKTDPKKKIKIVRIIARLNIGGPAIHTILLSDGLNRDFFETYLVIGKSDAREGDMISLAKERNLTIKYIPDLTREIGLKDIKAFFKICNLIKKIRPDIVHTHTAKAGALGRLAAILSGVPVKIHTFHGHIFDGYFSRTKARVFLWIEQFLGKFTDRVIVVSEKVREELVGKLKVVAPGKCVVIPLGLELNNFTDYKGGTGEFRRSIGLAEDVLLVGIVGRLVPIKNHDMFLHVAKKIKALAPELKVKFVIIGDGESRGVIEKRIKELGLEDDVIVAGWAKDLPAVYQGLDVLALTSLNEGTPVSIIEAMASGKAVIATDVGGVGDVVSDGLTGLLVDSGNIEVFASKLLELLKDKNKMNRLGAHARASVKEKYSKERLIRDIEGLYKECMAAKGSTDI